MLTATPPTMDLGTLKFGKVYEFSFLLENKTDNPITINEVAESCKSCTSAHVTSKIVNPKSNVVLNVAFTPGSTGRQLKGITVIYNDGDTLKVEFKGIVNE